MNIDKLTPAPQDKSKFQLSHYYKIPQESGCYVLTNHGGDILYIGQSVDICRRFEEHLNDTKKTHPTSKGSAVWFYWLEWDKAKLSSLERGWLNTYLAITGELPIMNSQNPPA